MKKSVKSGLKGKYRLEDQAGFLLRRAHQRATELFESMIGPETVSPPQFSVLVKLLDEGAVSQNQLGRLTHMDPATVMGVIKRLESGGLVKRAPHAKDKRKTSIELTPDGFELVKKLEKEAQQITHLVLQPLTGTEQKKFITLLKKLT